jgi:hypothetical protein
MHLRPLHPVSRRHVTRRVPAAALALTLGLTACLLPGCAGWLGPRTIEVSRDDILAKLRQKFPITRQVLGYLDITASNPTLAMLPQSNRVATQVDLKLDDTMFHKAHQGFVGVSFGLRYEPRDLTIRLDQVAVDEVSLPTLSPVFLDALKRLGNQAAREVLQGFVVRQLKPEDLNQAERLGYEVGALRVTATGLAVDLVPRKTTTAAASPAATVTTAP